MAVASAQTLSEFEASVADSDEIRRRNAKRRWLKSLRRNRPAIIGAAILMSIVVLAILAPWIVPYEPNQIDPAIRLQQPSNEHFFGTDEFGRDVFSRVIYGARVSLPIGVGVTVLTAIIGSILGLISGYYSRLDAPIMRVLDGLMAFPSILLAIAIVAARGPSTENVFVALTIVYIPILARLVRSTTLVVRQQPYVESARSIGLKDHIILFRYIFMNSLSPLIVQCTFVIAYAIISEASLSFLGAGVPPEIPSWGNMMRDGQKFIQSAWWMAIFPGIALFGTVLSLNILGDGLRDALDPKARER